ncbi:hypothetical protein B6D60_08600 [candidate division KSB1 bacterium 4484_87]|nr:MAG: hypothetical protein B6D60_08600 [candidate division KSB1 bacterium 4484_87]
MESSFLVKNKNIGAIILAGGRSRRFGQDKTLATLFGISLIDRAINIVREITNDIIIATNSPEKLTSLPYPKIKDLIPGRGPLGGIYTGLFFSKHQKNIIIPVDMPFISVECMEFLISHREHADVVVPIHDEKYEPLCAVYSRSCLQEIKKQLHSGNNQVFAFYDKVKTIALYFDSAPCFHNQNLFFNINSVHDMNRLQPKHLQE